MYEIFFPKTLKSLLWQVLMFAVYITWQGRKNYFSGLKTQNQNKYNKKYFLHTNFSISPGHKETIVILPQACVAVTQIPSRCSGVLRSSKGPASDACESLYLEAFWTEESMNEEGWVEDTPEHCSLAKSVLEVGMYCLMGRKKSRHVRWAREVGTNHGEPQNEEDIGYLGREQTLPE